MSKSTDRHTSWSVTINNPTAADEEEIALARSKGWKVEGQIERGENGTPHYQLLVKTPQTRFSTIKNYFKRGHIEPAKNVVALKKYVHKEDTRVAELTSTDDKYPSVSKMWELMFVFLRDNNWIHIDHDPRYDTENDRWDTMWFKDCPNHLRHNPERMFDTLIQELIINGYFVEHHAMNPQVRGAWKRYAPAILHRTRLVIDARNDLQNKIAVDDITQNVEVPSPNPSSEASSVCEGEESGSEGEEDTC